MFSNLVAEFASHVAKSQSSNNMNQNKTRTVSQEVLERQRRKKYSTYAVKQDQSTSLITPRKMTSANHWNPSGRPSERRPEPHSFVNTTTTRKSMPLPKKLPTYQPPQEKKRIGQQKRHLVQLLDDLKEALLQEDDEMQPHVSTPHASTYIKNIIQTMSSRNDLRPEHAHVNQRQRLPQSGRIQTEQHPQQHVPRMPLQKPVQQQPRRMPNERRSMPLTQDTYCQCGSPQPPPSINHQLVDEFAKFLQSKQQAGASISPIHSSSSDTYDSDYKTSSPLSESSVSINLSPPRRIYRSELNIALIPANNVSMVSTASTQPRAVDELEWIADAHANSMMDDYEEDSFGGMMQHLHTDIEDEDEIAREIMSMRNFNDNHNKAIFNKMEDQLADISADLSDSLKLIQRLSLNN